MSNEPFDRNMEPKLDPKRADRFMSDAETAPVIISLPKRRPKNEDDTENQSE